MTSNQPPISEESPEVKETKIGPVWSTLLGPFATAVHLFEKRQLAAFFVFYVFLSVSILSIDPPLKPAKIGTTEVSNTIVLFVFGILSVVFYFGWKDFKQTNAKYSEELAKQNKRTMGDLEFIRFLLSTQGIRAILLLILATIWIYGFLTLSLIGLSLWIRFIVDLIL